MDLFNFDSEYLEIDWLNFNVGDSHDLRIIASNFSKYFIPSITVDSKPILFCQNLKNKSKVSIRH